MKSSIEEINQVQRRVKIELDAPEVDKAFGEIFKKIQRKANLKGFRQGKAPLNIIKKFYGENATYDVADYLIKNSLFPALSENKLNPIANPVLETSTLPKEGEAYTFSAVIDVMPAIEVQGYKGLTLTCQPQDISDKEIEQQLKFLQKRQASRIEVSDKPAAKGHLATVSYNVFDSEGNEVESLKLNAVPVELGESYLIPDVEKAVLGMKAGESKSVQVTIPDNFRDKEMIGKSYKFDVSLSRLEEFSLPTLDDEFAKDLNIENLETLKTNIRSSLEREASQAKQNQLENDFFTQMLNLNPFEVPPSLVDNIIDGMIDELKINDDKRKQELKKNPEVRKQFLDEAKTRAKNTLILHGIIKNEKIDVSDKEVEENLNTILKDYQNSPDYNKIKKSFWNNSKENLLISKAMNLILEQSKIVEIKA
ncbi:MAG: trigger factor [Oligoflexales bacterium]